MRIAPLPPEVSDFIVRRVLEEGKILIQGGNHRILTSNRQRREKWEQIAHEVYMKFRVNLSPIQVQNHFNNRRRGVLYGHRLVKNYRLQADEPREFDPEYELDDEQEEGSCYDVDRMLYEYYKAHSFRQIPQRPKSQDIHVPPRAESCDVHDLMSSSDSHRPYNFPGNAASSSATAADCKPPRSTDATLPARPSNFARSPPMEMNNDDEILGDDSGCDSEMFNCRETSASDAQVKHATVVMLEKKAKFFEAWTNVAVQVQQSLKEITDVLTANMRSRTDVQMSNK